MAQINRKRLLPEIHIRVNKYFKQFLARQGEFILHNYSNKIKKLRHTMDKSLRMVYIL